MKAKFKRFPVDLYKRGVLVLFGTKEELYNIAKDILTPLNIQAVEDTDWEHTEAICLSAGADTIIYAPQRPYDEIIAHELSHAAFNILKMVDIDPTASEEAYTYLFEYLYYNVFLWLNSLDDVRVQ